MITLDSPITGDAIAKALRSASVAEAQKFLSSLMYGLATDQYVFARDWIAANPVTEVECPRCRRQTLGLRVGSNLTRCCEHCLAKLGAE